MVSVSSNASLNSTSEITASLVHAIITACTKFCRNSIVYLENNLKNYIFFNKQLIISILLSSVKINWIIISCEKRNLKYNVFQKSCSLKLTTMSTFLFIRYANLIELWILNLYLESCVYGLSATARIFSVRDP